MQMRIEFFLKLIFQYCLVLRYVQNMAYLMIKVNNYFLHLKVYKTYSFMFLYLFWFIQESDLFQQICCTNERGFTMHILDNNSRVSQNYYFFKFIYSIVRNLF
jgi:hypothetical protein